MIIIKIIGGLGNQLFQYAFGKTLEHNTGSKVYFDVEDFNVKYKLRKVSLQHFNVSLNIAEREEVERLSSLYNKLLYKIYRVSNGLFIKVNHLRYYAEKDSLFDETVFLINNDIYLNGHWQSEKYFYDIRELIKSEFTVKTRPTEDNLKTIDQINNSNSVSLHIRRGDYITNPAAMNFYSSCSMKYYENAIDHIAARVVEPVFFVFSDDIQWVKENLKSRHNLIFVDQNDADSNYEDLRLMSNCKHSIIANSTFSWWGAWLNNNDDKIVISPQQWFLNNSRSTTDLIPKNWIQL